VKIIIYTANIGNYDIVDLPEFKKDNPDITFILFTTNTRFRSDDWEVRYVQSPHLINKDNQRVARYFKLQPHKVLPPHDINIWFDSCLSLKIANYKKFIKLNLLDRNLDMVSYRHPKRSCLYDEGIACMNQGLDNGIRIKKQMERYRKELFPKNSGLFDTGFLIRHNTPKMTEFNDAWYKELMEGSKRDQLSHSYVLWKTKIAIASYIKGARKGNSPYLKKRKHIISRKKIKNKPKRGKEDIRVMNRIIAYKMRNR